jgi:dTDP-4-dehydrorhamnose reductase
MASHHVLLLGGHGKIAQLLTPLLLKRSWTVTSVIRTSEQTPAIEKLGAGLPGKLNVLVRSIEDVTSQDKALSILNEVKPDYIAWSAGRSTYENHSGTNTDEIQVPEVEVAQKEYEPALSSSDQLTY